MKRSRIGQFALGALVVAMCCGVHAQGSEPAAASEQAASAMSAKDAKAANRKLQKDVIRVLARTKGLVPTAITVRANNGDVVLEGAVPEQSQMAIATKAAEGVPGVKSVKNMLTLSQF
jgi:osmotically-inducible protein OsmY